jgi:hypothetical protein
MAAAAASDVQDKRAWRVRFPCPYCNNRISLLIFIPLAQVHVVHVQRVKAYDFNTASSHRFQTAYEPVAD